MLDANEVGTVTEQKEEEPDYLKLILTANIYDLAKETPLQLATNLSDRCGSKILLKREDLQPVFSFKIRGAYNKIRSLSEAERKRGIIACSAGNHAQGVAMAASKLGIKAVIVMPIITPTIKWKNVERLGSKVILCGKDFDGARQECERLVKVHGYINIPPYDDPYVIAGQGTIGLEILKQWNIWEIDCVFCCVGGGGLIAGIAVYIKRVAPHIKVIGVETHDANCMTLSLQKGKEVTLPEVGLFADGTAIKQIGKRNFELAQKYVDEMVVVSNDELCAAIKDAFEDTRTVLEPAGALAIAGAKKWISRNGVTGKTLVAVTSGANMNFNRLRFVAERAELGEQKEALISVSIPESSGSFITLHSIIHPRTVTEFSYRYRDPTVANIFTSFTVNNKEAELAEIFARLKEKNMHAIDISNNDLAKDHVRYMIGGTMEGGNKSAGVISERLFRFEFPERPNALKDFLQGLKSNWNISLFHYRNFGDYTGKVLVGIQVPNNGDGAFKSFIDALGYPYSEETDNLIYKKYLV